MTYVIIAALAIALVYTNYFHLKKHYEAKRKGRPMVLSFFRSRRDALHWKNEARKWEQDAMMKREHSKAVEDKLDAIYHSLYLCKDDKALITLTKELWSKVVQSPIITLSLDGYIRLCKEVGVTKLPEAQFAPLPVIGDPTPEERKTLLANGNTEEDLDRIGL